MASASRSSAKPSHGGLRVEGSQQKLAAKGGRALRIQCSADRLQLPPCIPVGSAARCRRTAASAPQAAASVAEDASALPPAAIVACSAAWAAASCLDYTGGAGRTCRLGNYPIYSGGAGHMCHIGSYPFQCSPEHHGSWTPPPACTEDALTMQHVHAPAPPTAGTGSTAPGWRGGPP